jgi:hypothetical protein
VWLLNRGTATKKWVYFKDVINYVRVEGSTVATMKNAIFWDAMPRGSCKNRRFGGT